MVAAKKMKEKTEIIKSILNVILTMLALMIIMFDNLVHIDDISSHTRKITSFNRLIGNESCKSNQKFKSKICL